MPNKPKVGKLYQVPSNRVFSVPLFRDGNRTYPWKNNTIGSVPPGSVVLWLDCNIPALDGGWHLVLYGDQVGWISGPLVAVEDQDDGT